MASLFNCSTVIVNLHNFLCAGLVAGHYIRKIQKMLSIQLPPSPLQEIHSDLLSHRGIQLMIKRDDLLHFPASTQQQTARITTAFCGNKYRKLKYNLTAAKKEGQHQLLTFGGAYSNHITATAEAGKLFGFKTIGVIRGEEQLPLNPSLQYAESCGMKLHYLDRPTFRKKYEEEILTDLMERFGSFYLLPEGGTNALAVEGVKELLDEIPPHYKDATFALSCGTGGTLTGIVEGLAGHGEVLGISTLKGNFLKKEIKKTLSRPYKNWTILKDYHFGGYAKFKPPLIDFINQFKKDHDILLDPIYTGKMFYGLMDLIKKRYFSRGSIVIAIHTGGLQGIHGFNERFGDLIH